ncbi:MAG: membrane protein insertase YidC, partial [Nannocystaceae bacterium]
MDVQRRTLLAIILCVAIWAVFDLITPKPPPAKPDADNVEVAADMDEEDGSDRDRGEKPSDPPSDSGASEAPTAAAETHVIRNDYLALELTNGSGMLRSASMLSEQFLDDEGKGLDIYGLDGASTLELAFGERSDFRIPRRANWEVVKGEGNKRFKLRYVSDEVEVIRDIELGDLYEGRLRVKVINRSGKPQAHQFGLVNRLGEPQEKSQYDIHRGLCATSEDVEEAELDDLEDGPQRTRGGIQWLGLDSKYFLAAIVPDKAMRVCEVEASDDASMIVGSLRGKDIELEPGESKVYEFGLYFGIKELSYLENYEAIPGVGLERAIDWGWFGSLSSGLGKQMLRLLRWFYSLTGIWGVAILMLTVVVKLVMLPLTLKQMKSMRRMKEIQPKMAEIKEKYADDRMRQGQEMQALFAREGVNPLAGCLPLVLQMPIWFALYAMLAAAVELYRVPFLWLPDLTQQDPYYILPLAMGGLMFLQTRLQPSVGDNQQAKMMMWMMPIMFTFMML